eukprot:1954376-Pleurochrysis_carterae.AAC.1
MYTDPESATSPMALLLRLVVGGVLVGIACGGVMMFWISLASRKLEHNDTTIQARVHGKCKTKRTRMQCLRSAPH